LGGDQSVYRRGVMRSYKEEKKEEFITGAEEV